MAAALIEGFKKEEEVTVKVKLPKSLFEEVTIYTLYLNGEEGDEPETIRKMIGYVLDRETKGKQGKEYKTFKEKLLINAKQIEEEIVIEKTGENIGGEVIE